MSLPPKRPLTLELKLPSSHPRLLEGLDIWLRLGLISDTQVRQICQEFLVCAVVPQPEAAAKSQVAIETSDPVSQLPVAALQFQSQQPPAQPAKPNFVTTMLQSLGAELSVRWLLFLGVFLVVVSSGVLAASQWERFPAFGQYGVLFAYTLTFCGLSFWAIRQSNLRLTAQTLLIVTLLLVPINFWAMDSFKLWQSPLDLIVVAIAWPTLTAITILLCNNRSIFPQRYLSKLPLINILGLSYLHWGWHFSGFPLIAVYLAMVGTTIITVYQNYREQSQPINTEDIFNQRKLTNSLIATVIVYALVVLLLRAIFVAGVDVQQLGLAIGICGWLATWKEGSWESGVGSGRENNSSSSSPSSSSLWQRFGGILLILGWLVSVINQPWQAIAVSGLALWFLGSRLQRYSLKLDLGVIFLIGLQTIWLGWRLVPFNLQQWAITTSTQFTNAQNEPWALLGVGLFPYLILMVALTESLYRAQKRELAKFGELLTLLLGAFLTTIAIINPMLRSLNLLFSTITLVFVTKQRSPASFLIYLTHILGVVTLCSMINWLLPNLSPEIWASILLALMVAEWGFSLGNGIWQRSAWHIGFGLATISFILLWMNAASSWYGVAFDSQDHWGIVWLFTPLALTVVANQTTGEQRSVSSYFAILAVVAMQILTIQLPGTRLIGLAVATLLMFANTRYLRNQVSAVITEGFALSLIVALLWTDIPSLPRLALAGWFVVGAIAILILWLTRTILLQRDNDLASIYAAANDKWAIALSVLELLMLTLHSALVYQKFVFPGLLYVIAITITLAAIAYRSWHQPTDWGFYGIGWSLELLTAEVLGFGERSTIKIAIANIALGFIAQLLGEWWRRRYRLERLPSSFHILPLIYGVFSVLLRFDTFTNWTGLCSLGVALIVIGVGRRRENFKPLLYLGIIGVSISAYELLFYQMSQAKGGALGDGLIAMSALGTSIMYAYRILSPWLLGYLRLTPQELKGIAHLHWVWSSSLLIAALAVPIEVNRFVALASGIFLIRYAIFQGKRNFVNPSSARRLNITTDEIWVYLGLLEAGIISIYLRDIPIGQFVAKQLLPWNAAIAAVIAYFIYILPWENWGWSKRPWQDAAFILPLIIVGQTREQIYSITLLLTAAFYIFLAKLGDNIRFTYISVVLIDWALFPWLDDLHLTDPLWHLSLIGLSLLYIAQVDSQLKLSEYKNSRHTLRVLSSSLICGWAIIFHQDTALIPGIFSIIGIFAGLALRVRAFLYIGTATFLITSIYQLVIFSWRYSFLKWVIGLLVGIGLISIAANFETRRAQLTSLIRNAIDEFQTWE